MGYRRPGEGGRGALGRDSRRRSRRPTDVGPGAGGDVQRAGSMGVVEDATVVDLFAGIGRARHRGAVAGRGARAPSSTSHGAAIDAVEGQPRPHRAGGARAAVVRGDAIAWATGAPHVDLALLDPPYRYDADDWRELLVAARRRRRRRRVGSVRRPAAALGGRARSPLRDDLRPGRPVLVARRPPRTTVTSIAIPPERHS